MRGLRLIAFYLILVALGMMTACGQATALAPTQALPPERPTLLGTANPPTRGPATPIPTPASCIFRTNPTEEIGLYRFNWDNATLTLNTKIGSLIVDGPRDLTPGPRQLVLLHNTQLPPQAGVIVNFEPGGTLIDDPLNDMQEVRDAGGTVAVQAMTDPAGDTKGMPNYLDIVRVERSFGYYPNSVVRVYLAGIHTGQYIWSSQSVAVSVAGQTFIQSNYSDGKVSLLQTSASGKTSEWAGPMAVSGNSFAFSLQVGVDAAMSAATSTSSSSSVDAAGPYPVKEFDQIWQAVKGRCS